MKNVLKTKRLLLLPMTEAELAQKAEQEPDAHLKSAYGEMLKGLREEPDKALWHTEWRICLRGSGDSVGGLGFKGAPTAGEAEIGYGIDEAQRGNGYAREAVNALCDWAFHNGAYYIAAEAEADNAASLSVLGACGFHRVGEGAEGERWEKEKPPTTWTPIYMCLGISIGMCLGMAFSGADGQIGTGMCLGMCFGVGIGAALGSALDAADRKKRRPKPPEK